jgi:enoyl-[acyl-carrier protein] reductase I
MALLSGKKILVTGLLSNRSIAYGIAQSAQREGAELAFTYVGERFKDASRAWPRSSARAPCFPATSRATRESTRSPLAASAHWGGLDGLVHAIGFAPREAIAGELLDGLSRECFRIAHDISSYSFPRWPRRCCRSWRAQAALLTLTYLGAERVVPHYNTMGLAKASLEARCATWRPTSAPRASA